MSAINELKNLFRPAYDLAFRMAHPRGQEWKLNNGETIRLDAGIRYFSEDVQSPLWTSFLSEIRPGDFFVDVGANIGLYSILLGKRGCEVMAFEPDPKTFRLLQANIRLNGLASRVRTVKAAIGATSGSVSLDGGKGPLSRVTLLADLPQVTMTTLDEALGDRRPDLLKIDVEGFEEMVLKGARRLLADPSLRPRVIFLELHPEFWPQVGVTTRPESLFRILSEAGYSLRSPAGKPLQSLDGCYALLASEA